MANTTSADWDISAPANSDPRSDGAAEIRVLREAVADRLDKEHVTTAGAGAGGEHKAGSALAYYQSALPTQRPDASTNLGTSDKGRMFFDTDDNKLYVHDGSTGSAGWKHFVELTSTTASTLSFEKTDAYSAPYTQSSLQNGTWMVWVYGTLDSDKGNDESYSASVTVNSVARTIAIDNHPDGSAPFCIPMKVTVSANTISISAASNVQDIDGMVGFRVGA